MSKIKKQVLCYMLLFFSLCTFSACESRLPMIEETSSSTEEMTTQAPEVNPSETPMAPSTEIFPSSSKDDVILGSGLVLKEITSYAGIYMEDGSDEVVKGIMSVHVENTTDKDLQLARVVLNYGESSFDFEITNLPAGQSAMLLEKNRKPMPDNDLITATAENVAFFNEPMKIHDEIFKISGMDGALNIENISSNDISGNIYVYYKYIADDIYYGGITFRTKVEGGLKSGEIRQVMTGHFNPDNCKITMVTYE